MAKLIVLVVMLCVAVVISTAAEIKHEKKVEASSEDLETAAGHSYGGDNGGFGNGGHGWGWPYHFDYAFHAGGEQSGWKPESHGWGWH